jgi:hypothetical protein
MTPSKFYISASVCRRLYSTRNWRIDGWFADTKQKVSGHGGVATIGVGDSCMTGLDSRSYRNRRSRVTLISLWATSMGEGLDCSGCRRWPSISVLAVTANLRRERRKETCPTSL